MDTKKDILDKMEKIKAEQCGLLVMLHRIDEAEIRFEIGQQNSNGTSRCVYSSKSIQRTLSEYASNGYTEEDGYLIDVWENDRPAADITAHGSEAKKAKVMFEINKKVAVGTTNMEAPEVVYMYETVFRSISPTDCQKEWVRKGYTKDGYVMDIREAPEGKEHHHVADINIDSMVKKAPRENDRSMLLELIGEYSHKPLVLAEKIAEKYGRFLS
jgi:hypothetical protein